MAIAVEYGAGLAIGSSSAQPIYLAKRFAAIPLGVGPITVR